MSDSPSNNNIP